MNGGPISPLGEVTISDHLRSWARRAPQRVAYCFYGRELTFSELDEASDRLAGWLDARDVRGGDRVGVMLPNCPQFAVAFHAILKLGAVHVPVNPMFRAHELTHELVDAGIEVLVALDALRETIDAVRHRTSVREVLFTALSDELPDEPKLPRPPGADAPAVVSGWRAALSASRLAKRNVEIDELAALNYTGGTTGLPKGCEHTQRNMVYTAVTSATAWRVGEDFGGTPHDATIVFIPAFWIAGEDLALLLPAVAGITCILLARWDASAVLEAADRYRPTLMVAPVDSYVELLEHPARDGYDASSLRTVLAASFVRKLDVELRRAWQAYAGAHSVLRECAFGMTETHTMDTTTADFQDDDADLRSRPVFCGRPMPGTAIRIVDPASGATLPAGCEGEITISSPSLFRGYWRSPDATAAVLRDGWLHTGDVGMLDADGCLHYLGRDKEMIKVNGMSVFPAEVEALLAMHPAVQAVAVVPQEDAERGQVPLAIIELVPGRSCTAEALRAWSQENMAGYKVPRIRVVDELPRTDTGKIKKGELLVGA